ncbi:LytR/AlgR family response regulator transcription factor [Emticicia agri]|uniref:Response regulator transcription factor n=1 Tax=Emticicia agri TaxID=2492393 RepID=A0A4Q5M5Z4_9BACT|nr:LytTR family DNA-binding domain-containing protein [Emticicia agri]RYU97327.1 response regulator transcription factor [Emticicia agri]
MLRAIIIDDEPNAVSLLVLRLGQHCPQIEIVATCTDSLAGVEAIRRYNPDVVFLDIEMPQLNGFQVLEAIGEITFLLVFVTAYDRFALKAFKYSALDYLLKPIDTQELITAVRKVEKQLQTSSAQIRHLKQQFTHKNPYLPERLALPYQNGVTFVAIHEIIYCEADDNYTRFHLVSGQQHITAKTLKDIQELLEEHDFLRVHRQFLINIHHIKKFVKGEGSYLVMNNEQSIPVSRGQKEKLMERFGWV